MRCSRQARTPPCHTDRVESIAGGLRRDTAVRIHRLTVEERIALALSLGDADLDLYIRTSGKNRHEALSDLRAQRARLRTPSRAASL